MANLSKFDKVAVSCVEYVHPWTDNCFNATAGLLVVSALDSFRTYTIVYVLSLLMRGRIPKAKDILRTMHGILQSTAFLTTSAFSYSAYLCTIGKICGGYNIFTASYIPAFMSSFTAILIERPSRRPLLTMYVANVATETLWRMMCSRGLVKSVKNGQVLIFGAATSMLVYLFRAGWHKGQKKDSIFDIVRFMVGKDEEGKAIGEAVEERPAAAERPKRKNPLMKFLVIQELIKAYKKLVNLLKSYSKHEICPHDHSCAYYSIRAGTKLFAIGLGGQIVLKLVLNMKKILKSPKNISGILFKRDTLKIGAFLGGFSFIFRTVSCLFRRTFNDDKAVYSIPATLLASIAFLSYPDKTAALYIMWKTLQILYNMLSDEGYLPKVPGGVILMYCAFTAVLFHAASIEPLNLRQSYWKFLHNLSGGRISVMDRRKFDAFGLDTHAQIMKTIETSKTGSDIFFALGRW